MRDSIIGKEVRFIRNSQECSGTIVRILGCYSGHGTRLLVDENHGKYVEFGHVGRVLELTYIGAEEVTFIWKCESCNGEGEIRSTYEQMLARGDG